MVISSTTIALAIVVAFVCGVGLLLAWLKSDHDKRRAEKEELLQKVKVLSERVTVLVHQKKSSEVRLGKIGENMAPFFEEWPYDPNKFRFLGNPVDGISFNKDEIVFVEIKTGKARLSASQKAAKKLIREGKVRFVTFRVGEDGCTLKVEED